MCICLYLILDYVVLCLRCLCRLVYCYSMVGSLGLGWGVSRLRSVFALPLFCVVYGCLFCGLVCCFLGFGCAFLTSGGFGV